MSPTATDRIHLSPPTELCVERKGILFHNVAPDQVLIEVDVENRGRECSQPTLLRLEAAPLGAFVRWRPLVTARVPGIAPGSSVWVRTVVRQPRPAPLGNLFSRPPRDLWTASASSGDRAPLMASLQVILALKSLLSGKLTRPGELPEDLLDLLDGPRPHWAGNLNVWIARRPVERHRAPRLRVHPGQANLALFCLGDGPDQYAFRAEDSGGDWRSALYDLGTGRNVDWAADPYRELRWHPVSGASTMLLVLRPGEFCERGGVGVHVTQRSSGKTALVEFDLDPAADGPGCYTV